jgi:serine/threonine protein kinase
MRIPIDLVVYENAAVIHMEVCDSLKNKLIKYKVNTVALKYITSRIRNDISHCLRVLHSLHIVHKDVKPDNIVWSQSMRKYVLCDFGESLCVKENKS